MADPGSRVGLGHGAGVGVSIGDGGGVTTICVLLFDGVTDLDWRGPMEVFWRLGVEARRGGCGGAADVRTVLVRAPCVAGDRDIVAENGLRIAAADTVDARDVGACTVLVVPGGPGVNALMQCRDTLAWVRRAAASARLLTSVCTGSLVLAAAGMLAGRRATTHWRALEALSLFPGVQAVGGQRFVRDGNVVTAGGITAGMDFGFVIAADVCGEAAAKRICLMMQYAPQPPYPGEPADAEDAVLQAVTDVTEAVTSERVRLARLAQDGHLQDGHPGGGG